MMLVDRDPKCILVIGWQLEGGHTIHGACLLPHYMCVTIDEVQDLHTWVSVPTSEI